MKYGENFVEDLPVGSFVNLKDGERVKVWGHTFGGILLAPAEASEVPLFKVGFEGGSYTFTLAE